MFIFVYLIDVRQIKNCGNILMTEYSTKYFLFWMQNSKLYKYIDLLVILHRKNNEYHLYIGTEKLIMLFNLPRDP